MKILLIGSTGTLGTAIREALAPRHEFIGASRKGQPPVDITDPTSIAALYASLGKVDAVVCAAGGAPVRPLSQLTRADFEAGVRDKLLGQVELVRAGLDHVNDRGSFTLISGVLSREPVRGGSVLSLVNAGLEAFVMAAAIEMPRGLRINVVSPTVFTESIEAYGALFPGYSPVPAADVARAFVKSVEGPRTGQVFVVG